MTVEDLKKEINNSPEAQVKKVINFRDYDPTFKSSYSELEIRKMVDSISSQTARSKSGWYHTFKFENVMVKNARTSLNYQMWVIQGLPHDLTGKSVLDIGTADGFFSFLCEQRGAKRVLAIDFVPFPGFEVAKKILNSNVEHRTMIIDDLDDIKETFDIVLLFGVYYHLLDPISALQKIFRKLNGTLFLAGHIIDVEEPIMCYYDEYEINRFDSGIWWVASPSCIIGMAKRIGFKNCEMVDDLKFENLFQSDKIRDSIRGLTKVGTFKFSK